MSQRQVLQGNTLIAFNIQLLYLKYFKLDKLTVLYSAKNKI